MKVSRNELWSELWKQTAVTLGAVLLAMALTVPLDGWGADSWLGLAGYSAFVITAVALGHLLPTALAGRVSWPRSGLGVLVVWLVGTFLTEIGRLGAREAGGWALVDAIAVGLPIVVASIGLRVFVPALRPLPRLRPRRKPHHD